nr:adenosine receptor A3-like [Pocillopora verrucosa]
MKALGNRSYEVEVCGRRYRRNRRQLRLTPETAPPMSLVELTPPESTLKPAPNLTEPGPPPPEFHGETKTERMPPENEMGTELEPQRIETRRSERRRRPPLIVTGSYCDLWKYNTEIFPLANLFPVTSIVNLAVISLERLHATFSPFKHRFVKKWVYGVVIGTIWLMTSSRETVQVIVYNTESVVSPVTIAISPYTYWSVSLLVICICYISIFIKVRRSSNPQRHGAINRERKLAATLLWVTLASLLTWLPFIVFSLNTNALNLRSFFHIRMTLAALVGANSLLNPIVYALRMPDFRDGICRIFRRTPRQIAPGSLPRRNPLHTSRLDDDA